MIMHIPYKKTKNGITISVKVDPRSSKNAVEGTIDDNVLKVKLTAPPAGGEANRQLIEILSKETGIKKYNIKIIRGLTSRKKIIEISGIDKI
jgi:uncharacterized protein (TIGR00251 family)